MPLPLEIRALHYSTTNVLFLIGNLRNVNYRFISGLFKVALTKTDATLLAEYCSTGVGIGEAYARD